MSTKPLKHTSIGIAQLIGHLSRAPSGLLDDQISRLGVPDHVLLRAESRGLVQNRIVLARRLTLNGPVFDSTRDSSTRATKVESLLRSRWNALPKSRYRLWHLSGQATDPTKLEHDIHLVDVYAHTFEERPELSWLSERKWTKILGPRGHTVPDALLVDSIGKPVVFIDFAGSYRSDRTRALCSYAASQKIPIQLW